MQLLFYIASLGEGQMRFALLQGLLTEPLCFISYIDVILPGSDKHGRSASFADKEKNSAF